MPEPAKAQTIALQPPPSRSLRTELQSAQGALARNDRPAFDAHLQNAREILASYPPGGERNAATEAMRVLDDAARVWDAQFDSPFFDEASDAYARANRYPGYKEAVRRGMLTDDREHRYYPAAESRAFLTKIAADRLSRLGIRPVTQRADRSTPRHEAATTTRSSSPSPRRVAESSTRSAPRRSSTPRRTADSKPRKKAPAPAIATSSSPAAPAPAQIAAAAPPPSAPPASAPRTAAATPPPAAVAPSTSPDTALTETPADTTGTATSPAETTTSPSATTTSSADTTTSPTETTTSARDTAAPAAAQTVQERRSVVVPALLILIGLGVLIVLFRASK